MSLFTWLHHNRQQLVTTTPTPTIAIMMQDIYDAPTGSLPNISLQCIAPFPQLASLLNQFKSHATSGPAAPCGQTVLAALSPASINDNIDNQVKAAQQLQPSTAANQPSAIVTASVECSSTGRLQSAVTSANSASPAPATPAHFADPTPASTATSAGPPTRHATPVCHPTGCNNNPPFQCLPRCNSKYSEVHHFRQLDLGAATNPDFIRAWPIQLLRDSSAASNL